MSWVPALSWAAVILFVLCVWVVYYFDPIRIEKRQIRRRRKFMRKLSRELGRPTYHTERSCFKDIKL